MRQPDRRRATRADLTSGHGVNVRQAAVAWPLAFPAAVPAAVQVVSVPARVSVPALPVVVRPAVPESSGRPRAPARRSIE